jgi:alkaline phosphatase D
MKRKVLFSLLFVALIVVILSSRTDAVNDDLGGSIIHTAGVPAEPVVQSSEKGDPPRGHSAAITHGPISGEVTDTSAVLWARGNEPGALVFEVAESPSNGGSLLSASIDVDGSSDFAGKVRVEGLKPGQQYAYQVYLNAAQGKDSDPVDAQFRTAPATGTFAAFDFTFGAGLGGQGYCRDPETGWVIFETMLAEEPDFFVLLGDSVYVDSACPAPRNVPGAEGPYTDLEGFRTRYRYHLEDPHYAALLSHTPVYVTWDDHEILNDFSGLALNAINPQLFADGIQAYFEYWPLTGTEDEPHRMYRRFSYGPHADFFVLDTRSYRDPNVNWDPSPRTLQPKTMLGEEQFAWLQQELADSEATWKFIVTSVPLSYPTGFPQPEVDGRDGWANYSERSGYETELMALLFFLESHDIQNVVFLAGDTHWPFALSYDPDRDGQPDFYELGSSPMSSIPLPPADPPDQTFNPTVLYAEGEFMGDLFNFGHIAAGPSTTH